MSIVGLSLILLLCNDDGTPKNDSTSKKLSQPLAMGLGPKLLIARLGLYDEVCGNGMYVIVYQCDCWSILKYYYVMLKGPNKPTIKK